MPRQAPHVDDGSHRIPGPRGQAVWPRNSGPVDGSLASTGARGTGSKQRIAGPRAELPLWVSPALASSNVLGPGPSDANRDEKSGSLSGQNARARPPRKHVRLRCGRSGESPLRVKGEKGLGTKGSSRRRRISAGEREGGEKQHKTATTTNLNSATTLTIVRSPNCSGHHLAPFLLHPSRPSRIGCPSGARRTAPSVLAKSRSHEHVKRGP
jgi:hypothetical protein